MANNKKDRQVCLRTVVHSVRNSNLWSGRIVAKRSKICKQFRVTSAVNNPSEPWLDVHFELVLLPRTHIRIRGLKNMAITCDGQPYSEDAPLVAGTDKFILAGDH